MFRFSVLLVPFFMLLLLVPCAGHAESEKDSYFLLGIGPQWRDTASDKNGDTSYKTGFALNGAAGYRLPHDFRIEFEGAYFYNEADTLKINGLPEKSADGHVDVSSLFGNLYYDLRLNQSRIKPYVGLGAGSYKASVRGLTSDDLKAFGIGAITADSGWTFAWQARVGTSIVLNEDLDMVVGYRYVRGNDMDIVTPDGDIIHPNLRLHNIELGIRFNF